MKAKKENKYAVVIKMDDWEEYFSQFTAGLFTTDEEQKHIDSLTFKEVWEHIKNDNNKSKTWQGGDQTSFSPDFKARRICKATTNRSPAKDKKKIKKTFWKKPGFSKTDYNHKCFIDKAWWKTF